MSVEDFDVVDLIRIGKTGDVVLTVRDHLDWCDGIRHPSILQGKRNRYVAFVESGEIFRRYPDAKGKPVAMNVVFKFGPYDQGSCSLREPGTLSN
jgi:hypothetical protein